MQKVMVIGWDSSDFRLLTPWLEGGYLPNLKNLLKGSKHGILKSNYPPVTPIAWSTIVTGKNAAKHGVSGFMSFRERSYETYPINASERHGKDVWELLSDYGKKVAVIGVPLTYPVRKVNGFMISGFLTPDRSRDYFYPKELGEEILSKIPGYAASPGDFVRNFNDFASTKDDERSVRSVFEILEKHIDATIYLAENKEWDFFMGVFNETDWVQHRFWSCMDKKHPKYDEKRAEKFGNIIRDVHMRLDEALGRLMQLAGDAHIIIVSDHGVAPLYWYINTNYLLYKNGRIQFRRNPMATLRLGLAKLGYSYSSLIRAVDKLPLAINVYQEDGNDNREENSNKERMKKTNSKVSVRKLARNLMLSAKDIDWSKTTAFARVGHGEIFLNKKKFFPNGTVDDQEYEKIRLELVNELKAIKHENSLVMEQVFVKENLFEGPYSGVCPDIQIHPNEGYFPIGSFIFGLKEAFVTPGASYGGSHSMNGICVLREIGYESSARVIQGAQLVDIVPTILHLMNLPIPSNLDGKSLADRVQKPLIVEAREPTSLNEENKIGYTKEEEEDIEERLRSLGYI
jgi:predicted AlkP superfamily phosphohydrolase/phosphomutase